jgi:hypothetical protein
MTVVKRTLKIILVIIMLFCITICISNVLSISNQATPGGGGGEAGMDGTIIENPNGTTDCQGPTYDC